MTKKLDRLIGKRKVALCAGGMLILALWVIGYLYRPIAGFWHDPLGQMLNGNDPYVQFVAGKMVFYNLETDQSLNSSYHNIGTYRREGFGWVLTFPNGFDKSDGAKDFYTSSLSDLARLVFRGSGRTDKLLSANFAEGAKFAF